MEILLWLVPPVVVTLAAMGWVGWVGREGRGEVDREEAVRRLGVALDRYAEQSRNRPARTPRRRERSTGVAVRRSPPADPPGQAPGEAPADPPGEATGEATATAPDERRRAS